MKKFNAFIALFLGLVLICSLFGCSRDVTNGQNGKKPSLKNVKSNGFLRGPFDVTVDKLPAHFAGNDIEDVRDGWEKLVKDLKKGEFETSDELALRIKQVVENGRITKKIKMNDYVAFCLNVGENRKTHFDYDADSQTLKISHCPPTNENKDYCNFPILSREIKYGTYTGANSFGVKKEIIEEEHDDYDIIFDSIRGARYSLPHWILTEVSPDFAKNNKENLAVCCVGKIGYVDGVSISEYSHTQPKLDFPFDLTNNTHYLYLTDIEFWIYNKKDGDVIAKFTPDDFYSNTPRKLGDVSLSIANDETPKDSESKNDNNDVEGVIDPSPTDSKEDDDSKKSDGNAFSTEPFDINAVKLPANFKGDDIREIGKALENLRSLLEKNEFETTDEYNGRIQSTIDEAIANQNFKNFEYVCFCLNVDNLKDSAVTYDADNHETIIRPDSVDSFFFDKRRYVYLNVGTPHTGKDYYIGTPAKSDKTDKNLKGTFRILNVPVELARENKDTWNVCCIGKLNVTKDEYSQPSGIGDVLYHCFDGVECNVPLKDVEFWINNRNTGEIYAKFSLEDFCQSMGRELGDVSLSSLKPENSSGSEPMTDQAGQDKTVTEVGESLDSDSKNDAAPEETEVSRFSSEPFDINVSKLPPNFEGNDPNQIESVLVGLENSLKKDEFETTNEYNERIQKQIDEAITSKKLKNFDYVCFCLNVQKTIGLEFTYDADRRELQARPYVGYSSFFEKKDYIYLCNGELDSRRSCYIGTLPDFDFSRGGLDFVGAERDNFLLRALNVPADFARENKDSLNVCLIGKLNVTPSSYFQSFENGKYWPKCFDEKNVNIALSNVEFWINNKKTGEIYARFSLEDCVLGKGRKLGDVSLDGKQGNPEPASEQAEQDAASDEEAPAEEVEEPKLTWEEVMASIPELPQQTWETKKPTVVVKSDAKDLAKILVEAKNGAIVHLESGAKLTLDMSSLSKDAASVLLDKAIAVVGEDEGATIVVDPRAAAFEITSKNVFFKNVTFQCASDGRDASTSPIVKVKENGKAFFINCAFDGSDAPGAGGVWIEKGESKFWKCSFKKFDEYGLCATNKGLAEINYCELLDNVTGAKVENKAQCVAKRCRFAENRSGYAATAGGGGSIENSYFDQNGQNWQISSGSKDVVELNRKTNVIVK